MHYSVSRFLFLFICLCLVPCADAKLKHRKDLEIEAKKSPPGPKPSPGRSQAKAVGKLAPTPDSQGILGIPATAAAKLPDCQKLPSLEALLSIPKVGSVQAAPKGSFYFLSDAETQTLQLFRSVGGRGIPEKLGDFPSGVTGYRVSPDGTKVLVLTDQEGDEQFGLFLLTPENKQYRPLVVEKNARVESFTWAPDSSWFAFTSNARNGVDFDLYRYHFNKGIAEKWIELKGAVALTDISRDGRYLALDLTRSYTDSEVGVVDAQNKRVLRSGRAGKEFSDSGAKFSADSKNILFISDRSGRRQLHHFTLGNADNSIEGFAERSRRLTQTSDEIDDYDFDRTRETLVYSENVSGYSRLKGWKVDPQGRSKRLFDLGSIGQSVVSDFSLEDSGPAGYRLLLSASASNRPPAIWRLESGTANKVAAFDSSDFEPTCYESEELVSIPSFDGLKFPAFLFSPSATSKPNPAAERVPYLVQIHGGPESQFRPAFNRTLLYLRSRGFGIMAPNIRGSTGYGRAFTLLDNYQKRMDSVRDAVAATQYLVDQKRSGLGHLGTFGGSYGGFMVLRAIQVAPQLFAAASESVGITNLHTFLERTKPYRRALREAEYGPLSDKAFLESVSPMTYSDQIRTPLLIFHGQNDPRVPFSEAEQLVKVMQKNRQKVELVAFADEGHGVRKRKNAIQQARKLAYFFELHLQKSADSINR